MSLIKQNNYQKAAMHGGFFGKKKLVVNSVLDVDYSEYFGFTRQDVEEISEYYGVPEKISELCAWYDGYLFGKTEIFNPWSVISYFKNHCIAESYWLYTGNNDVIGEILKDGDGKIYEQITTLVNGGTIETYIDTCVIYPEIRNDPKIVFSFLLMSGYLKIVNSTVSARGDHICSVTIPNKEIVMDYRKEILQKLELSVSGLAGLNADLEGSLISGNTIKLKKEIADYLMKTVSTFDTATEGFYHGFMLGICASFGNYYVLSNRECGEGRFDIAMYPKSSSNPGIIIELKSKKNCEDEELKKLAENALEQIKSRKYDTEMNDKKIEKIYRYGVAFSGKRVEVVIG